MRKVLFPQKFHFLFSVCFSYFCLESYVTRGDLCRASTVRNDDVLLPIAHTATDTPGGDSCIAVCSDWGRKLQCHGCRPHRLLPQCRRGLQEWAAGQGETLQCCRSSSFCWGIGTELRCRTCRWHSREVKHLANILTTFGAMPSVSVKLIGWSPCYSAPLLSSFCPEDSWAGSAGSVGCCITRHRFSVIQSNAGRSCSDLR